MLNKEEIEKALNNLWNFLDDVLFGTLYSQEELEKDLRVLLNEYNYLDTMNERKQNKIQELETREQKLIDKLEEDKEKFNKNEKNFMTQSSQINASLISYINESLSILKGEKK